MADRTYIDWRFARSSGRRLSTAGPRLEANEMAEVVAELRDAAVRAHDPVAETAQLGTDGDLGPVHIVDRATWIDVNVVSLEGMLAPVVDKITAKRLAGPVSRAVTAKVSGGELGGLMAFMSSKVLGQYDIAPGGTPSLMLVAPNVVAVERELDVDPHDFRLWVCLHEETHRVQFTAVPWLREHVVSGARDLLVEMAPTPEEMAERVGEMAKRLPEVFREGSMGLTDLFATPEQRERMAQLTAVMSLLEGHADVVMDDVGPQVVPSVETIRARFGERRDGLGNVDRLLRRLMGLEAKMRQYKDGAAFVRSVQSKVGVDGFNAVWAEPVNLPTPAEIQRPQLWVERVHGSLFK
ncbi:MULTISPECIES: zinc-dependent metalloprotease [unclassified Dermacoccus]|uniref:zinc-dependent metalloprotease n=1 Tax=unclassified Dermacoccus TaxID=2643059 RepID=UPI00101D5E1A|nr:MULTISPECIES: zinc-dependent metalloprotease [unclassified Dermacoccus]MBZ4498994.1 zinc-dependent metalloprotease [Dermacoccus sp. Tok2021]RYI22347.1 coenzyme F420 biosynthesis protein [Dermacoccus sp. 147Ba]